ncbi:hypothetical protein [Streptomyces sp. NPDC005969]|uniref:hypothetical protein n=1 Tax=Streptomyces sp. NPDC005969 TaxID=3156722 RepID=UPI00340D0B69
MNDTTYTDAELTELDRIARQIDIDAPAERVWELVARPGWYVNDGAVEADPDLCYEGDVAVVRHPTLGEFRFRSGSRNWRSTPARQPQKPPTDGRRLMTYDDWTRS